MSLDISKIATQVSGMLAKLQSDSSVRLQRLQLALDTIHAQSSKTKELAEKIEASRTSWLVAGVVDKLDAHCAPSALPANYTVLTTDGSHIDIDRHRPARCYLINIGTVILNYGANSSAKLDNIPNLYFEDKDLSLFSNDGAEEQPIDNALLGIKRTVDECDWLARLASATPDQPTLALLDGSLIMWALETQPYPQFVVEQLLTKGYLSHLDTLMKLGQRPLAVASYISFPRSSDVVNALRVALCPANPVDCDRCPSPKQRACQTIAGIVDRELFENLLSPGERSALFTSRSKVVKQYGPHQVYFFYLRLDDEIARIELPGWAAINPRLLDLVHTLVIDQCHKGQGYPVALSEAHEKAVLTGSDRELFWQFIDFAMTEKRISSATSAKSRSKRTRWV